MALICLLTLATLVLYSIWWHSLITQWTVKQYIYSGAESPLEAVGRVGGHQSRQTKEDKKRERNPRQKKECKQRHRHEGTVLICERTQVAVWERWEELRLDKQSGASVGRVQYDARRSLTSLAEGGAI